MLEMERSDFFTSLTLELQRQGFEKFSVKSFWSYLMRQIHFLLESGYFVTVVNFVVNEQDNYFWDIRKQCLIGLYFQDIFPIGNLVSLWSLGSTVFQNRAPK